VANSQYDAVIVGAGHNGLVCALYLARAGWKTLVLERNEGIGQLRARRPLRRRDRPRPILRLAPAALLRLTCHSRRGAVPVRGEHLPRPGTKRGLRAHRRAASPAQTGTGKQGPTIVRPRVMYTRVSCRPKDETRDVRETYGLMGDGGTGTIAAIPGFRPIPRSPKAPSLLQGDPGTGPAA